MTAIQKALAKFSNAGLTVSHTPIYKMSRLSSHIGREIYVMREDLTGFAIGGNKIRKLDYLIGDAIECGADTLLTSKANNFTRNAAAAGRAFGLDVHVVLPGDESGQNPASLNLFRMFGAALHFVPNDDLIPDRYEALDEELRGQGRTIYELPQGGSTPIGALGYINAFDQIAEFSRVSGVRITKIMHATGSAGTQAGLLLGQHISKYDVEIIGMCVALGRAPQTERIRCLAVETAEKLGISFEAERIIVDDRFIGPGYAIPSSEGQEAVKLFASLEGLLLDDVYTGKAASGLLHYARHGQIRTDEAVLFIHTGGNAGQYY